MLDNARKLLKTSIHIAKKIRKVKLSIKYHEKVTNNIKTD